MSQLLHEKEKFGNDIWFANIGSIRTFADLGMKDCAAEQLDRIRDANLRCDDVIVVGYPKSGNTWTHHMTTMLVDGTTDLPAFYGRNNFTYLDQFTAEWKLPPDQKPRVFMSHLPFGYLPRDVADKKVKLVYVTRNPKDVFVSLHCYVSQLKPPRGYSAPWPQFFEVALEQELWYGGVFGHLKDWGKEIESHPDQPVFECNYEDSKKDIFGQVERLNQFLGTNRSRELCQAIADACKMDQMSTKRKDCEEFQKHRFQWKDGVKPNAFYRKGIVGDWKKWFTVAQNERFDDVYMTKMAGYRRAFTYE